MSSATFAAADAFFDMDLFARASANDLATFLGKGQDHPCPAARSNRSQR